MGLYDNYKLTNSNAVPVFVGGLGNDIKEARKELSDRYNTTLEGIGVIGELGSQVPVRDDDKETLSNLMLEANKNLDEWASRGDYENLHAQVGRFGRQYKNKLGALAQQKAAEDGYIKSIQELGLSQKDTQTAIEMARENSSPVQFTPDGRITGGGFAGGPKLMKDIDVLDKIRKHLAIVDPNKYENKTKIDNGQILVMQDGSWQGIDPAQLQNTLNAALQSDPELKAWLGQRMMLDTYASTKGQTNESVAAYLQSDYGNNDVSTVQYKQQLQGLIDKGMSPLEAHKSLEQARIYNQWYDNILQYSRGKLNTSVSNDYSSEKSPELLKIEEEQRANTEWDRRHAIEEQDKIEAERRAAEASSGVGVITTPSPGLDISDATTYKDLDAKLKSSKTELSNLRTKLSKYYSFNEDGSIKEKIVNIPNNVTGLMQSYVDSYNELQTQHSEYHSLKDHALNQAATKHSLMVNGKQKTFETYQEAENYYNSQSKAHTASVIRSKGNATYGSGKDAITKEQLAKIIEEGGTLDYEYGLGGRATAIAGVTTKEGKKIYFKGPGYRIGQSFKSDIVADILNNNPAKNLEAIKQDAETNFNSYRKNASVQTNEFTFDTKGKENSPALSLNVAVKDAIAGNPGAFKLHEYGKTSKSEISYEDLDLDKASVKTYSAMKGGTMKVNLTVPTKDGKDSKIISAIVPSSSDLPKRINDLAGNNSDAYVSASARSMYKNSLANQIAFNPRQGVPVVVGKDKAGKEAVRIHTESSSGQNRYYIEYLDTDGKYKKLPAKSGTGEYSSTDNVEAAHIAEQLYNNYYK